jgi:plastocyanin
VIVAAGGGIYYYQFVVPHETVTHVPVHRLVWMNAIVVEDSTNGHGFEITRLAYLNQSTLPKFTASSGANMTNVSIMNYTGNSDNRTISAFAGDTITFYIFGINSPQTTTTIGHGFQISGPGNVQVIDGSLCDGSTCGTPIAFGQWFTVTVKLTATGTYIYFCTIVCSGRHGDMNGSIEVS